MTVYEVDYCAYTQLRRPIFIQNKSLKTGEFQVLMNHGQTGVSYLPASAMRDTPAPGSSAMS